MALLSKREWHLKPTRAIDDTSEAPERYALERFRKITNRFRAFRAQRFGVWRRSLATFAWIKEEIRIENSLRSTLRCLKLAAR